MKSLLNLVIAAALLLSACGRNKPVDLAGGQAPAKQNVQTVKLEKGRLSSAIKLPGELKPFEKVDIYPKVNGFIKDIYVDRGSEVHAGQVLMTLQAPELDQQLQAVRSKLIEAEQTANASRDKYTRLLSASKTPGAVSELDLVNARAKFDADSALQNSEAANVRAVQAMEDYLIVKAPFDGVITERNVHPGTLTGPNFKMDNKPLLVLQDNKKLRLEIFIPEGYADKLDMQNNLNFWSDAMPGKTFTARISRSSNSLYDDYRSEAVEADVDNAANYFKPGMYVETSLKVKSDEDSYLVPSSAIVESTEKKYVIALLNGKTRFIDIKDGVSSGGSTEVFGDFKPGETIIKNPDPEIPENASLHQ
ncbi:MAG TPA: efflux RND transporter periplasmic adaptor subunit [Chitinophagales bacterium]|nr:efflux RND transporter periplasmic adaptor subunit [Chitinophagales bacterium]